MACAFNFLLRVAFLSFFALNAWNHLANVDKTHEGFAAKYTALHKEIDSRVNFKLPEQLHHSLVTENSRTVVEWLLRSQLALIVIAALIMPSATVLVALNYLMVAIIKLDVFNATWGKLMECECLFVAVALFAASIVLSCKGKKGKMGKNGKNGKYCKK